MRIYRVFQHMLPLLLLLFWECKKGKGAICSDGWRSHSTGSGTCSWHGGVHHYIDPNEIAVVPTILLVVVLIPCALILFHIIKDKITPR